MRFILPFILCLPIAAASPPSLLDILSDELQRNFTILKQKADPPPYYLDYTVTDDERQTLSATLGTIDSRDNQKRRVLDITLRVGTPQLDNYHAIDGKRGQYKQGEMIALDDVPDAIRRKVWLETDRMYKLAARRLIEIKSNQEVKVKAIDSSADFSSEPPAVYQEPPPPIGKPEQRFSMLLPSAVSHPCGSDLSRADGGQAGKQMACNLLCCKHRCTIMKKNLNDKIDKNR